ncbi:DNA-directed RNA polymerase subunit omega [Peptoniphilus sp. EMRHCC_23]|uniref:DNA-directed RNA polymerase subunit omega n=1 Tax=Peptoniphilus rachelemmaiella TaxID=2811779 RepID=UPI001C00139F|nr:DNA-directed RNA polymerase subunit omega [Peptoniphilus rachelemmaiella]
MNILSFGEISKITNSRYALATLVSNRARELVDGEETLIDTELENPVSISLEEINQGAVKFTSKERFEEIMAEKERREEALRRELAMAEGEETADEE